MKKIKTGLLAFGMSGRLFHAPFISNHPGFEFIAVTERSKKEVHKDYKNVSSHDSIEELLSSPDIDLVIVNTPNITHFEFACRALELGKHVLIEKPFAIQKSEAEELFELSRKMNRHIMAYQNRRYDSDFMAVKEVVDSGKLGEIIEANFRFDRYKYQLGDKVAKESETPGAGIAFDLGPHLLDQAISLFGKPEKFQKHLGYFRPGTKVDDFAQFLLTYKSGLIVTLTTSLLVAEPQAAYTLNGTKGSFIKGRTDRQEEQLKQAMNIMNPSYGTELEEDYGILTLMEESGIIKNQVRIKSKRSNYSMVYDDVYNQIINDKEFPVKESEILLQLDVLTA